MAYIGGNIKATIQTKISEGKNAMGEAETYWVDAVSKAGWLGFESGEKKRSNFNAKIEETTHVFVCDYRAEIYALADQDTRMIIKGIVYDVLLIDNPDEMNEQLEIYLRKVGAYHG
jgi:head-tail adaptor